MQACNAKPHATGWATTCAIARFAVDRVWLLLILCCFGGAAVHAAPPYSNLRLSEYQKQDWQVEDGLPENNVRMIAQRPDGALLLATSSGLATFDGQRFQNVPINIDGLNDNEAVNAVLHEPNDDLWIGTDGRGVLHRTRSGTVNISERAGLYNERVRMLYLEGRKVLWIATQNGIERFADDRLERVPIGGMISGDITTPFAEDSHGGMFFVTSSGLFLWENGAARRYPLHTAGVGDPVAVYRDPQQNIWVGTMTAVLQLIPRGNSAHDASVQYDEVVQARVPSPVSTLVGDTSHNLWIGTRQDGLWRYGSDGVSHWTSRDGLPDNYIRSLYFDEEENLWIGMRSGGLSRWRKGPLAPYGEPEGFHATYSATALADSRGDLWLGTWGKGLFRRHNGKLTAMSPPGMPIATPIRALAEDRRGHVWVGTWFDGVYRYDGKAFHHYLLGVESPGNAVSAILPDKSGGLWVGTYTGLFYFPSGEPDAARSSTLDSKGYMWTGTKAGGLASVHQERVTPLPSNGGLAPLLVNTAIEDDDGHLWLGTSRGIVRLLIAELQAVADGEQSQLSAVVLGKADGMRSSEIGGPSKPASTRMADGTLWFATTKGFVHTTDVAEKLGPSSPTAFITGWTLSNDPNVPDVTTGPRVDIEAGQPDIIFFFNAEQLSTTLDVRQHPYFYQTWYFYLALCLLATALAALLFRRREQLMKGRIGIVLEERNRIACECHDTLMAGFAAISWQLEATAKLFRDSDTASTPAAHSCELARSMVSHCQAEARRIIWDLRDTDEVTNILSQALSRTLSANHMKEAIETSLDVEGEEVPLAPGCVHHLVCIGQEAVSNAMRHAEPSHISVRLKYEIDALNLSIRDDGRGFQASDRSASRRGHFGIPVMEERARKLGGTLRLQTAAGAGTEVTVRVSFNAMQQPVNQEHHVIRWIGI